MDIVISDYAVVCQRLLKVGGGAPDQMTFDYLLLFDGASAQ